MAAKKCQCALFASATTARVEADGSVTLQPSVTVVLETSTTKKFTGITYAVEGNQKVVLRVTNSLCMSDPETKVILDKIDPKSSGDLVFSATCNLGSKDDVILKEKLDYFFLGNNSNTFKEPYKLKDKDVNGLILKDFLDGEYTFKEDDINDVVLSKSIVRKYALSKRTIDWSLFWNCPYISKANKVYCKPTIDLDVCKSNSIKDIFYATLRTMYAKYPERPWTLNIYFGDPSSGKTTLVQNTCALIGAPFVKITGDPTISMTKLIMTVGPENIVKSMQDKQFFVDKLKAAGVDDVTISSLDSEIAKAILTAKDTDVQLTEQDSIILQCMKYNLPLVVLLDEINMFTTLLQATLADVITSGYVNVGVHTYKFNPSNIIWFGAYNPNTYKASPFELKFRDRALFFCVDMPSEDDLISHKQRKNRASMLGTEDVMNALKDKVSSFKEDYPEFTTDIDDIFNLISNIVQTTLPSPEAVDWFFTYQTDKLLGKRKLSFKEGEFTDSYKDDVVLASEDLINEATSRMIKYINKVNEVLLSITKGIDTKNPDSNFYFYIPNRAVDYFCDLIHCFNSVDRATDFFIYNLIPNGDTCRYGNEYNPAKTISSAVRSQLDTEIKELQKFLFSDFDFNLEAAAIVKVIDCKYQSDLWIVDVPNVEDELDGDQFEPVDNSNVKSNSSSSAQDLLDEAEDLLND